MDKSFIKKRYTPLIIMFVGVLCYCVLLLDAHLKYVLQTTLTLLNGADVTVEELNTSFSDATLNMQSIAICNKSQTDKNKLEIGKLHVDLSWSALLRGSFVIENSELNGVYIDTKRKTRCEITLAQNDSEKQDDGKENDELLSELTKLLSQDIPKIDPKNQLERTPFRPGDREY